MTGVKLFKIKYGPIIIFTFSKKKCEDFAKCILCENYIDYKSKRVTERFLSKLAKEYTLKGDLDFLYKNQFKLFRKGIGIHHGSLSPFLKDVTEILFQSNLLYILFATETFSIGLNMPSKTVIFSSLTKFDGKYLRFLNRGEFIQMSGRAGRRGIDQKGIVISILNKDTDPIKVKKVIKGHTEPIGSVFKLTINTFLDFIGPKKYSLKKLFRNSFFEFQKKIKTRKKSSINSIFEKRIRLLVFPKLTLVHQILSALRRIKKVIVCEQIFDEFSNSIEKNHSPSISLNCKFFEHYSLNFEKSWFNLEKRNFLLKCIMCLFEYRRNCIQYIKIYQRTNLDFKGLSIFKNKIFFKLFVLCLEITITQSCDILSFVKNIFCFLKISYHLKLLSKRKNLNRNIANFDKNSVFNDISRFTISFWKIGFVTHGLNLSRKGQLCSKINYKENFVLLELIYRGLFSDLSFSLTITLLVALVCEDYHIKIPLNPNLFLIHDKFQAVIFDLYSIFDGTSLALYLLKIKQTNKQAVLNSSWAWCNDFSVDEDLEFSINNNNFLNSYLEYILNILEIITNIYQCLGNVFLASRFEGYWFKLKRRLDLKV